MVDFITEIKGAKEALSSQKTRKTLLEERLTKLQASLLAEEKYCLDAEKARIVIQAVALEIQQDLEFRITNIVTMALAAVFPDPYTFKTSFVERRNQTEVDMFFVKDGNECDPMESSGGGAIDIASIALRMAVWSIRRTRAIQILDEPAKFLSRDMQEQCSLMLKEISEKLGIQMIIVSHIPEMITAADRIINVDNIDGYSKVKVL